MDKAEKNQRLILSENLKERRRLKNWNQAELAEEAGVSTGAVKQIETCVRWPRPDTLEALAKALGATTRELLGATTEGAPTVQSLLKALGEMQDEIDRLKAKMPPEELLELWNKADESEKIAILRYLRGDRVFGESKKKA